jgi:hypothetical protein
MHHDNGIQERLVFYQSLRPYRGIGRVGGGGRSGRPAGSISSGDGIHGPLMCSLFLQPPSMTWKKKPL